MAFQMVGADSAMTNNGSFTSFNGLSAVGVPTVPTGQWWRVTNISYTLWCSATVGNRKPIVYLLNASGLVMQQIVWPYNLVANSFNILEGTHTQPASTFATSATSTAYFTPLDPTFIPPVGAISPTDGASIDGTDAIRLVVAYEIWQVVPDPNYAHSIVIPAAQIIS